MLLKLSLADRSARGLANEVGRLISSGQLSGGVRLPTIRALAADIGVSPTTVAQAWKLLAEYGLVESRGKLGTIVRDTSHQAARTRFQQVAWSDGTIRLDLTTGTPDPALLPDLGRALSEVSERAGAELTSGYLDRPVLPALEQELITRWPYRPEHITLVDGALDALDRLFRTLLHVGDRVLVENPTFPPVLDLIERAGAQAVPLALDDAGIIPSELASALPADPVALVLQPRAQNPTGVSMRVPRMLELATILKGRDVIVIEDDHAGGISPSPQISLGDELPGQVVRILSFSKAFGPDLRLAAVGGPRAHIDAVDTDRNLGPGWSSRLLQHVLLQLLRDPDTLDALAEARRVYALRRSQFQSALQRVDVNVLGDDGINLWVPVADENAARISLAGHGIAVAPGSPFISAPLHEHHIRITCSTVAEGHQELAEIVAVAARRGRRGSAPLANIR